MDKSLCAIITLIASLLLVVYGFKLILRQRPSGEGKQDMISDQLRGFAFLILAQIVFTVGMTLCYSGELFKMGESIFESL